MLDPEIIIDIFRLSLGWLGVYYNMINAGHMCVKIFKQYWIPEYKSHDYR